MRTVLETCIPRESILKGTFNPEVFTAAISPVFQYYKTGVSTIDTIYTDGITFFRDATYPTEGLKQTVSSVFRRISGDSTAPSIYRLETAFGGGKTHTLIACVHIANRGTELATVTEGILDALHLPNPGTVTVVGIAGDEIPVNKTKGDGLIPYTLWGEMAYQIGGKELYNDVRNEAESFAAPGKNFLESVLGNRKMLIMLDELAQYAARLDVAVQDGASQLAAFLMTLNGYAKNNSGIAVIVAIAGISDAFSKQTEKLTKMLNSISTSEISQDDAVVMAEKAAKGVTSVTMRDATAVTPVQASEISSVLAKRLFSSINSSAAREGMEEYCAMYQRNSSMLPEEAISERFKDRLLTNYPFHPTLVDFLNQKLAQAENFQGTRGVLRVLAMSVRSIWSKKTAVGMIHTSDIDLQNSAIVSELLGRTGSADLQLVLNADIGSSDSHSLQGGLSNAQRADDRNPHPDHVPLYEMTWKTVFLHSLVGRAEGHASKMFGISQQNAIFAVSTPLATPPQVRTALDEISESAFYLRYEDGKYFAHLDPTINSVLAMIRQTINDKQIRQQLRVVANGLIRDGGLFYIEHDVHFPQDVPDNRERPTIAVIGLDAEELDPREIFTTKGDARPRERQNMVLLLVPKTVKVKLEETQQAMFSKADDAYAEAWQRVESIARQVLAIKALEEKPQSYGISPGKLRADLAFVERSKERQLAIETAVNEMFASLYYPGQNNAVMRKEIRSASGEGGATIVGQIMNVLKENGAILTTENTAQADLISLATTYFFSGTDKAQIDQLIQKFFCYRSWPILASKESLEQILREGVTKGIWIVYKMSADAEATLPGEMYTLEKAVPIDVTLLGKGYSIMTPVGAKMRGWTESDKVPSEKVRDTLKTVLQASGAATVQDLTTAVQQQLGNVTEDQVQAQIQKLIHGSTYSIYEGQTDQSERPSDVIDGFRGAYYTPAHTDVIISKTEQSERGWLFTGSRSLKMDGNANAKKIVALLKHIGSLYTRSGAISTIDALDITDLQLPSGGTMRIALDHAQPSDLKRLDELFQVLVEAVKVSDETDVELVINDPDENCALIKELKK